MDQCKKACAAKTTIDCTALEYDEVAGTCFNVKNDQQAALPTATASEFCYTKQACQKGDKEFDYIVANKAILEA